MRPSEILSAFVIMTLSGSILYGAMQSHAAQLTLVSNQSIMMEVIASLTAIVREDHIVMAAERCQNAGLDLHDCHFLVAARTAFDRMPRLPLEKAGS